MPSTRWQVHKDRPGHIGFAIPAGHAQVLVLCLQVVSSEEGRAKHLGCVKKLSRYKDCRECSHCALWADASNMKQMQATYSMPQMNVASSCDAGRCLI